MFSFFTLNFILALNSYWAIFDVQGSIWTDIMVWLTHTQATSRSPRLLVFQLEITMYDEDHDITAEIASAQLIN